METITNWTSQKTDYRLQENKKNFFFFFLRITAIQAKYLTAKVSRPSGRILSCSEVVTGMLVVQEYLEWWQKIVSAFPARVGLIFLADAQKPRSGCSRSVANNSSGILNGFRSRVDSTITWVPGFNDATRSLTVFTSETVTPPTTKRIRTG